MYICFNNILLIINFNLDSFFTNVEPPCGSVVK